MKIYRAIINIVFASVLPVCIYLVAALILSLLKTHPPEINCRSHTSVFVSTNGIHLDVIVSVKDLDNDFVKRLQPGEQTQFMAFGWGDKNFYLHTPEWKDLSLPTAFKALFLRSESAMHVTAYRQAYSHWREIRLCPEQMDVLVAEIVAGFKRNASSELIPIGVKGYGNNDRFYEAHGSFTLFRTCNVWVNSILKKAGVETSLWSPFDFGVLYHLR